MDITTAS